MPKVPTVPPADRFWARLDRFECECPSCGRLIITRTDKRFRPAPVARAKRRKRLLSAGWNPYTQHLVCPWCGKAYTAGLLLYPHRPWFRSLVAPPDTVPDARLIAELRRRAGGWHARALYDAGQHVNQVITAECSCGERWSPSCLVHGDPDGPC